MTQTGTLQLKEARFNEAMTGGTADVAKLLAGTTGTPGALASMSTMLDEYTKASGILLGRARSAEGADRLSSQIARMEDRLALRRLALQQEFTAADAAMARLKNQSGSICVAWFGLVTASP